MRASREALLLLILASIPAVLSLWLHPKRPALSWTKPGIAAVSWSEAVGWSSETILWIDARASDAYRQQHIPGAISLNESAWEQLLPGFLTAWRPGVRVIVYCDSESCDASQGVAQRIQHELNLSDLYVLKGGWTAWQKKSR